MIPPRNRSGIRFRGLALLVLLLSPAAFAQPADVVLAFDEGVRRFETDEYAAALESFQTAESSGWESPALYYNMGNTYFRLNQLGRAILYYERARRLEPGDPLILHSLQIARERTVDRFSRVPDPIWTSAWNSLVGTMRPDGLFAVGLLFFLFGIGLAVQRIWSGTPNDWIRRGIVIGLGIGTLLVGAGLFSSSQMASRQHAVVLETSAQITAEPSDRAQPVVLVHEGLLVETLDETDGWAYVRLTNGVTGWVELQAVEAL